MSEQALAKTATTVLTCIGSDVWKEEVKKVIPKEIALEAMLRVARSTASDPKFNNCDPKSFLLALLKCGRAGLYPDGREAHLIAFGRDVQAIFDVKGICALAGRAGILVTPKLVFEKDDFTVEEDDGTGKTKITHRVDYRKGRGEIQAVYSRAVMPNGQVDYEIMSSDEVERVRQHYSKAKDSTPWKNSWGEMAKKTVIKRHSKRWDMSPEIRQALNADDDSIPDGREMKVSEPIFSAPAAEPEKIIDVTPPAEVKTAEVPPEPVKPKPRAAKVEPKPVEPVKVAQTPVEALKGRINASGVPLQKILDSLNDILGENHDSLESMFLNNKDAFELLERDLDDIAERINA